MVVPEIANVCAAASSSATKNDGLDGAVICDPVIAARAADVTTRPASTTTQASTEANLILAGLMEPSSAACNRGKTYRMSGCHGKRKGARGGPPLPLRSVVLGY